MHCTSSTLLYRQFSALDAIPEKFEPRIITLPRDDYSEMTKTLNLSSRILDSTNNMGPFPGRSLAKMTRKSTFASKFNHII